MNGHLKTIFDIEFHWLDELCPGRPQQQPCRVCSPSATTKWSALSRHLQSRTLINETIVVLSFFPVSSTNYHFKTILCVNSTHLKSSVFQNTWIMNIQVSFAVPLMNANFKIIIWIKLSVQLKELCLFRDLNNECAEFSPVSSMNGHFKTSFWVKPYKKYLLTWIILCPRRPE